MQLYLETSELREAEKLVKSNLIDGIITNPDIMSRYGTGDTDSLILKLSNLSEYLHIEPKGETFEVWVTEAQRLIALGLDKEKTIISLPVTEQGIKACKELSSKKIKVKINFIYNIHQAYLAMKAGASMISIMTGELQDKGSDAFSMIEECIQIRNRYSYDCKIVLGSIVSIENIRQALKTGVEAISIPNSLFISLQRFLIDNPGAEDFIKKTRLHSVSVRDILKGANPKVNIQSTVLEAVVEMTKGGMGAVAVLDDYEELKGVFTDGDLRRHIQVLGDDVLKTRLSELTFKTPVCIDSEQSLSALSVLFKDKRIDNILVTTAGKLVGMVDIQDLNL